MSSPQINRMILDKLETKDLPANVRGFIREILQHEQGGLDQARPRYTRVYENLLNKYALSEADINQPDD